MSSVILWKRIPRDSRGENPFSSPGAFSEFVRKLQQEQKAKLTKILKGVEENMSDLLSITKRLAARERKFQDPNDVTKSADFGQQEAEAELFAFATAYAEENNCSVQKGVRVGMESFPIQGAVAADNPLPVARRRW
jgi:hypothetical protein